MTYYFNHNIFIAIVMSQQFNVLNTCKQTSANIYVKDFQSAEKQKKIRTQAIKKLTSYSEDEVIIPHVVKCSTAKYAGTELPGNVKTEFQ